MSVGFIDSKTVDSSMKKHLLLDFCSQPVATMKSIWIYRLRATISFLGLVVLTLNVVGFLCGFVFFDLSPQQITDHRILLLTRQPSDSLATRLETSNRPGSIRKRRKTSLTPILLLTRQPSDSLATSLETSNRPGSIRKRRKTSLTPILLLTRQPSDSLATSLETSNRPGSIRKRRKTTLTPQPSSSHSVTSHTVLSRIMTTTRGFPWGQKSTSSIPTRGGLKQPSAPCLYRKGRDSEDGVWYDFSVDDSLRFYAYSAFIDDRPSIGSEAVVRIIALSTKLENDYLNRTGKTLYCAFHHETANSKNQTPVVVQMESKAGPIGFGLDLDAGVKLKEYIFTCPLGDRRHPLPVAVTIVGNPDRLPSVSSCVPIEVPVKPQAKEDFAVCVQVSYGQLDPHRLIEWFELQRILGVSRVGVYDLSLESGPGLEVLRHYAREGFVQLRKTDVLPVPGRSQFLLHGSPVINDCLYRNMHSFNWILVIDFDEVLVPKIHSNLSELAAHLDKTSSRSPTAGPPNYLFLNQYFFLDSDPDSNESTNYTIIRYRRKAPLSPNGYAMKSYVDPQGCVQMHNHYCMGVAKAFEARNHYEFVDPAFATSHHYKRCHLPTAECQKMLEQTTQDDIMLTYKTTLKRNVEKKIKDVLR